MEPRFATRAIEASNDRQWATDGAAACGSIVILSSIIRVLGDGSGGTTTTAPGGAPTATRSGGATRDLTRFATGMRRKPDFPNDHTPITAIHPTVATPWPGYLDLPMRKTPSSLPALRAPRGTPRMPQPRQVGSGSEGHTWRSRSNRGRRGRQSPRSLVSVRQDA